MFDSAERHWPWKEVIVPLFDDEEAILIQTVSEGRMKEAYLPCSALSDMHPGYTETNLQDQPTRAISTRPTTPDRSPPSDTMGLNVC